jgi:putative transposase
MNCFYKLLKCHSRNDRDINAAKNIRDEALRLDVRRFPPYISKTRQALGTSAAASGGHVSRGGGMIGKTLTADFI